MLLGSCGLGLQFVWCGVVQDIKELKSLVMFRWLLTNLCMTFKNSLEYRAFPNRMVYLYYISCLRYTILVKFDINKKRRKFYLFCPLGLPPSVKQSSHTHTHAHTHGRRLVSSLLLSLLNCSLSSTLLMYSSQ